MIMQMPQSAVGACGQGVLALNTDSTGAYHLPVRPVHQFEKVVS